MWAGSSKAALGRIRRNPVIRPPLAALAAFAAFLVNNNILNANPASQPHPELPDRPGGHEVKPHRERTARRERRPEADATVQHDRDQEVLISAES